MYVCTTNGTTITLREGGGRSAFPRPVHIRIYVYRNFFKSIISTLTFDMPIAIASKLRFCTKRVIWLLEGKKKIKLKRITNNAMVRVRWSKTIEVISYVRHCFWNGGQGG